MSTLRQWSPCAVLVVLVCLPAAASGQITDGTDSEGAADAFCFNARPLADCHTFAVTEVALGRRLVGTTAPNDQHIDQMMDWRVVFDIGLMVNRDERSAIGGSGVLRIGDEILILGAGVRFRRWLPNGRAWELSAAALHASSDVSWEGRDVSVRKASYDGVGVEVGGSWIPYRWVAAGAEFVAMPFAGGGWDFSLQPSIQITGPAGLTLGLLFGAVASTSPSMSW